MSRAIKIRDRLYWGNRLLGGTPTPVHPPTNMNAGAQQAIFAKNGSGGTVVRGDVVVWKRTSASSLDGFTFTTSTTIGNPDVMGVVLDSSIEDGDFGVILIWGPFDGLKVDGTLDIAIGDPICHFSSAKIGMFARDGRGVFALALEGYTANDSSGVIDCFVNCLGNMPGSIQGADFGTGTAAAGAVTVNSRTGLVTSEALTTAAGSDYTLTLTNNRISANSVVMVYLDNGTNTTAPIYTRLVTVSAGQAVIVVRNAGGGALNGTIKVGFAVLA